MDKKLKGLKLDQVDLYGEEVYTAADRAALLRLWNDAISELAIKNGTGDIIVIGTGGDLKR